MAGPSSEVPPGTSQVRATASFAMSASPKATELKDGILSGAAEVLEGARRDGKEIAVKKSLLYVQDPLCYSVYFNGVLKF